MSDAPDRAIVVQAAIGLDNTVHRREATPAFPVGEFLAVHRSPRGDGWTITHIPTGWAAFADIYNQGVALEVAEDMAKLDWNFDRPEPAAIPAATRAAMAEIKRLAGRRS
jgi:hypothetical protein